MWSAPTSKEQQAYYSTHAPKRKVYGLAQTGLQLAHVALAFAAWQAIFGWAFRNAPAMQPIVPFIAVAVLALMHIIWRATWDTYWYDRLDDSTETDSSIFLPLVIMVVLVVTEKQGATMYFTQQVATPTVQNTLTLDEQLQAKLVLLDEQFDREKARVEDIWQAKASAATAAIDRNIAAWQRKKPVNAADQKFIASNIAAFKRQRDAAAAQATTGKAEALEHLLADHNNRRGNAEARHLSMLGQADANNTAEFSRYQADLSAVHGYAWLISLFFVGCAAALGYARVRINVRSGILPIRTYSTLDQHGSVLEKFWIALADGISRQLHRGSVALHSALSPKTALTDFDGNVIITPGDYNSPAELNPAAAAAPIRRPVSLQKLPTPPAEMSAGERLLRDRAAQDWKQVVEYGDPNDEVQFWECRRELLGIHGIVAEPRTDGSVKFHREKIAVGDLDRLYPIPKIRAFAPVHSEPPAIVLASPEPQENAPLPVAVTQEPLAVTQSELLERSVKHHVQDLKRETPNLGRKDANKGTVVGRIISKYTALEMLLKRSGAEATISAPVAEQTKEYLVGLRATLDENGFTIDVERAIALLAQKTARA